MQADIYNTRQDITQIVPFYHPPQNLSVSVSFIECLCVQTAALSTVPLDGGVRVLQAVHDGSPMALHGIVVRGYDLLE